MRGDPLRSAGEIPPDSALDEFARIAATILGAIGTLTSRAASNTLAHTPN